MAADSKPPQTPPEFLRAANAMRDMRTAKQRLLDAHTTVVDRLLELTRSDKEAVALQASKVVLEQIAHYEALSAGRDDDERPLTTEEQAEVDLIIERRKREKK